MASTTLILGPWGSGTTAAAGIVSCLGIPPAGPFYAAQDDRTPIPLESETLCALVHEAMDYEKLEKIGNIDWKGWRQTQPESVCVKLPALAFFLDEIEYDKAIIVRRSMDAIESTRLRRGWASHTGREGAETIYRLLADLEALEVDYERLEAAEIAHYLDIEPSKSQLKDIENWLKS